MFGTVTWFALQLALGLRLRKALRGSAAPTVELRRAAEQIARRTGLRHCPRILIVEGTFSPMLCGLGKRASIVMPSMLLTRLNFEAQVTILAHELAHCRRGDQWVRLLELLASGLYWWHPVVWWARRRIEAAEEQCCDAHVLETCGARPRVYAEALLDIVDFISEPARRVHPVLSSGIRERPLLQKRLRDLMEGCCVPTIAPRARRVIVMTGALSLFCHPTFFITQAPSARATSANERPVELPTSRVAGLLDLSPPQTAAKIAAQQSALPSGPAEDSVPPESNSVADDPVWATAISPNGRSQVSVRQGYRCEFREVVSNYTRSLTEHRIACVAFSPDSASFVSGELDGTVRLWDAVIGAELEVLTQRGGAIYSVAISPAGDRIAVAGEDGVIEVVNLANNRRSIVVQLDAPARCVRFSPSGQHLAVAADTWNSSSVGQIAVYDLQTRTPVARWQTDAPVGALQFLPGGQLLVAEWSGRVTEWSWSTIERTGTAQIAKELVSAASFSADTRVLEAIP
jgi:hypothetical protein